MYEAERDIYDRAVEELDAMAFGKVEPTASVKFAALSKLLDRYDARQAREQGEITVLELQQALANTCSALEEHPAAKAAVLEAYRDGPLSVQDGEHA